MRVALTIDAGGWRGSIRGMVGRSAMGLALAAVLAASPATGVAAEPEGEGGERPIDGKVDFSLAGDVIYVDYREFDRSGDELGDEHGPLPGLRLTARGQREAMFAHLDLSFFAGELEDGQRQSARAESTTTDTRLSGFGARIGRWFEPSARRWGGFARFARRIWARNPRSSSGPNRVFEEYRWSEVGVGVRRVWEATEPRNWTQELTASAFAVVDGTVFVELSNIAGVTWDDTTLDLGDGPGLRVSYTADRPLSGDQRLHLAVDYTYWEFGRSDSEAVTSDGRPTGTSITEPRSVTQGVGLNVGVVF